MLEVKKLGVLLEPTEYDFESFAVFNPGAWREGEFVHLFYRAMDKKYQSSVGYAKFQGPTTLIERCKKPIITRQFHYESKGIEDPRVVKVDDTFYLFYVAHDGKNAVTAYAISHDLKNFKKMGVITAQITYHEVAEMFKEARLKEEYISFASFYEKYAGENVLFWAKDAFLFPKKIKGKFALINRVLPGIQIVFFERFEELTTEFWKNYFKKLPQYTILENEYWFETNHIGGGCPPIETEDGWLLIFHATESKGKKQVYHAAAALFEKENPLKLIARLDRPLFSPTEEWEKSGFVPNVVFPTGTALFGEDLYIYYGAADQRVAVASVNIKELLKEIKKFPASKNYDKK